MADAALSRIAAIAKRDDPERYLCALFAPVAVREALFTLIAFNAEIARTRERVSEAMLGQIRLQWWRETLDGIEAGTPRKHEVVTPLAEVIRRHGLPRAPFDRLIDAREADLDDAPFETLDGFRAYARDTSVPLSALMLDVLGIGTTAVREKAALVAEGTAMTGLLRATVHLARVKRVLLPADLVRRHGVRPGDLLKLRDHDGLRGAATEIAAIAGDLLADRRLPAEGRAAFLAGVFARRHLSVLASVGHDVLHPSVATSSAPSVWRLWWADLLGRG
jgi:NADH dehydrogenase [ubiquinone] 1 alpha subcomplex assembly factor 6